MLNVTEIETVLYNMQIMRILFDILDIWLSQK